MQKCHQQGQKRGRTQHPAKIPKKQSRSTKAESPSCRPVGMMGIANLKGGGLFGLHQLLDSTTQLVGTGRRLTVTADAIETVDNLLILHSFNQFGNTLQVAVTTAIKLHVDNATLITANFDELRTCTTCLVHYTFHNPELVLLLFLYI